MPHVVGEISRVLLTEPAQMFTFGMEDVAQVVQSPAFANLLMTMVVMINSINYGPMMIHRDASQYLVRQLSGNV